MALSSNTEIEITYVSEKEGKCLIITTKRNKNRARTNIYNIINTTSIPENQTYKPGRSNKFNINFSLVSYTTALQQEGPPDSI